MKDLKLPCSARAIALSEADGQLAVLAVLPNGELVSWSGSRDVGGWYYGHYGPEAVTKHIERSDWNIRRAAEAEGAAQ